MSEGPALHGRLHLALRSPDLAALERAIRDLEAAYPGDPLAGYARAEVARRQGNDPAALALSAKAIECAVGAALFTKGRIDAGTVLRAAFALPKAHLDPLIPLFQQFGHLAERTGLARNLAPILADVARQVSLPSNVVKMAPSHAVAALGALGFSRTCDESWADHVFEVLLVPWLLAAASQRQFDVALMLESIAYFSHVQRTESLSRFASTTSRWIPGLAAHAKKAARELGFVPWAWKPQGTRRVALYIHRASSLAHVAVVIETLSAVARIGARNYEFSVFVMDGHDAAMHEQFQRCGVRVRYLDRGDARGWFERLTQLREILERENFAACLWISLIAQMAIAFPVRIAPLQGWWAMKYHRCDVPDIDFHLAMENVVLRKWIEGREWRTFGTASTDWLDPALASAAHALRSRFAPDAVVAASIGRENKLNSPSFLGAVAKLLQRHPRLVFLWTGETRHGAIQSYFDTQGVSARVHFEGWVDTKLYAQAIDLFLDSFPFPCGLALKEAMAAGKAAVMYRSLESLGTGVPGAITPVIEGTANAAPEVRAELQRIFTADAPFDLYACAASADDYVEKASRLIEDQVLRARSGEANREFVRAFLSSPEDEARKFLDHLDAIFATPTSAIESAA